MPEEEPTITDAAAQAKKAMDRARAAARLRGTESSGPKRAGGKGSTGRRRPGVDPKPYGSGREPIPLARGLDSLLVHLGWKEQVDIASIGVRWGDIVGEDVANHSEVVSFEEGVLTLRASSTAWAEQLTVVSGHVRQRVNEEVGRPLVTRIRVLRPATRSWTKGPLTVKGRGPRDTYG